MVYIFLFVTYKSSGFFNRFFNTLLEGSCRLLQTSYFLVSSLCLSRIQHFVTNAAFKRFREILLPGSEIVTATWNEFDSLAGNLPQIRKLL